MDKVIESVYSTDEFVSTYHCFFRFKIVLKIKNVCVENYIFM